MDRTASVARKTKETDIRITINLDGSGKSSVRTGIGFFDHMVNGFAKHGFFDLAVEVKGDLSVDTHHTVEDTGIVLGSAIREALGEKQGIVRFGSCILPMDETLILCSLDLSGRPYLGWKADFGAERLGTLETETIHEFFYALACSAGMNLHIRQLDGVNSHHIAEAMFKAFGKALDMAVQRDDRIRGVLSTKGEL
ncbi:MAG: imidazoleglycerol-phosphate dehydratase HisB [Lachnospiraceae bacterium]|jgi:imidazoleglycerol-phosphate dehydratase|nr:imidazoleglycerol-phosphate dehydratase HisB [Lachnospiraceae bacterium]